MDSSWLLGNSVTRVGFSEAKKKKPKLGNISASLIKAVVIGESGLSVELALKLVRCRRHGFKTSFAKTQAAKLAVSGTPKTTTVFV